MMIHPASFMSGFDISYALEEYKVEFFGTIGKYIPAHTCEFAECANLERKRL